MQRLLPHLERGAKLLVIAYGSATSRACARGSIGSGSTSSAGHAADLALALATLGGVPIEYTPVVTRS
jgi:hypothetical protein